MIEVRIQKNDAGMRLDRFLLKAYTNLPPSLMYKGIRQKKIKRNRKRAEPNEMLEEGDVLQIFLPEEFFRKESAAQAFTHLKAKLSVVYEDDRILLLNKKAGMSVHADEKQESGTLIDHVKAYLMEKGEYDPQKEQSFAPALCNRIDRNTAGLVLAAKDAESLRLLNEQIRKGGLDKRYLCIAHGIFEKKEALLSGYLLKDSGKNLVKVFDQKPSFGEPKEILTEYRVLAETDRLSLLEVHLLTGRTHQIRAHFSHIGHPLFGDGKYGSGREDRKEGAYFQALCAYRLTFCPKGDFGCLSYLAGKTFSLPPEEIPLLTRFPFFSPENRNI